MDPGDRELPVALRRLREALAVRQDAYWQLLSAAVGAQPSLDCVVTCVTAEQLERGALGDAGAPSLVRERVEAVAAYDPGRLGELVLSWRRPAEIGDHPFWIEAWTTALRHLAPGARRALAVDASPELAFELAIVDPAKRADARPWAELVRDFRTRLVPYEHLRRWAHIPLTDRSLDATQLQAAPPLMLRLLRGRDELLDASSRCHLRSVAHEPLAIDALESALVLERVALFDPQTVAAARMRLAVALPTLQDPRTVLPLAYALANPGWVVP